ncbi:MAG: RHS repeat domain-containing protein [Lysobacteraceae bacterium]
MNRNRRTRSAVLLLVWSCPLALGASTQTYDYSYDEAGRLTEVRTESSVIAYNYDAAGNITGRASGPNLRIFESGFEGGAP